MTAPARATTMARSTSLSQVRRPLAATRAPRPVSPPTPVTAPFAAPVPSVTEAASAVIRRCPASCLNRSSQRSAACSGGMGRTVLRDGGKGAPAPTPRSRRSAASVMRTTRRKSSPHSSGGSGESPAASRTARSMRSPWALARDAALAEAGSVPSSSPSQAALAFPSSACRATARRSASGMPSRASISSETASACWASERKRRVRPLQRQVLARTWATASKSTSAASTCSGSPGQEGGGPAGAEAPPPPAHRPFILIGHAAISVLFGPDSWNLSPRFRRADPGIVPGAVSVAARRRRIARREPPS